MKKSWNAPTLDVLSVKETMLGTGWKQVDWTYIGGTLDVDLTNEPAPGSHTGPIPEEYFS
ncbi:paeninodin family lasso peptide [Paenibacillus kobensis]|uniref:paeninodin family lasso peptide n=1 Tax=Paenibacillus kobensis TaxID=59841 RepID=UPI000FDBDE7C|nr:paeninodin family lasso peptide [Paenibacillus kobensis]